MKASSGGGLETEDLFWSAPHHYHRPSDTISAALRSPALQTPLCVCLCQPSSFHCYATHMHAHSPLKTTHAVERIIRLLNHTSQIHHGSVTVGSVGVKERRKFCHLSVLSSAAHYGTAPFSARTYLCVRIFLCKTFSIISINGLDVPSFISNFFFLSRSLWYSARGYQKFRVKLFSKLFRLCVLWSGLSTQGFLFNTMCRHSFGKFECFFKLISFWDHLETVDLSALRLYHPNAQRNQDAQTICNALSSLHGWV